MPFMRNFMRTKTSGRLHLKYIIMRKIYFAAIVTLLFLGINAYSQDTTITFRFYNYQVVEGTTHDTLIFDVQAKGNTSNTYPTSYGIVISFSQPVFGDSALPVYFERLELATPSGYNYNDDTTSASINRFSSSYNAFVFFPPHGGLTGGFDISTLSNLTTQFQGVARYKMLILGTGNTGIEFYQPTMNGQQFYILTGGGTQTIAYGAVEYDNSLLTFPSTPTTYHLMISEVADPSDSNGDFVEIYNAGAAAIDLDAYPHYLTCYDGATYQSVALTGSMAPGDTRVIGGPSFASAYPGKTADHTAGFVEGSGTLSFYLTAFYPYSDGIFIDRYEGSSTAYTAGHAVRPYRDVSPDTTFTPGDWKVTSAATMDMTPGSHRITLTWDGSSNDTWRDTANWTPSYVPDVGHNAEVPAAVAEKPTVNSGNLATCNDFIVGSAVPGQPAEMKEEEMPDEEQ